jgi:hypothetical protein
MSAKVVGHVFDNSRHAGGELLVLLAIADHAHEDGTGAFPALATLARKTKLGESTIRRHIQTLQATGELRRERRRRKNGTWGRPEYSIPLQLMLTAEQWTSARQRALAKRDQCSPVSATSAHYRAQPVLTVERRIEDKPSFCEPPSEPPSLSSSRRSDENDRIEISYGGEHSVEPSTDVHRTSSSVLSKSPGGNGAGYVPSYTPQAIRSRLSRRRKDPRYWREMGQAAQGLDERYWDADGPIILRQLSPLELDALDLLVDGRFFRIGPDGETAIPVVKESA